MNETANITETITEAINSILSTLISSIDNSLYETLDELLFINSDILKSRNFEKIVGFSPNNGILAIANSLLFGFIIYFAFTYLFSYLFARPIESPLKFLLKVVFFAILLNFSYFLCQQLLTLFSNITLSIRELGENLFNTPVSFNSIIFNLNSSIFPGSTSNNFLTANGIIKAFISITMLNLLFAYALRYIMIKFFVLTLPIFILFLLNDSTTWIFKSYLKSFLSLLFLQVFISLILLLTFTIQMPAKTLFDNLLLLGCIYAISKANSFIKDIIRRYYNNR